MDEPLNALDPLLPIDTPVRTAWSELGIHGKIIGYGFLRDVDEKVWPVYLVELPDRIERTEGKYLSAKVVPFRVDRTVKV